MLSSLTVHLISWSISVTCLTISCWEERLRWLFWVSLSWESVDDLFKSPSASRLFTLVCHIILQTTRFYFTSTVCFQSPLWMSTQSQQTWSWCQWQLHCKPMRRRSLLTCQFSVFHLCWKKIKHTSWPKAFDKVGRGRIVPITFHFYVYQIWYEEQKGPVDVVKLDSRLRLDDYLSSRTQSGTPSERIKWLTLSW